MRISKRKAVVFFAALVALAAAFLAVRRHLSVDEVAGHEQQLRAAIDRHPWISLAAGLAVYYVVSLVPATSGKSIAFGWLFGFWRGVLIVDAALTLAAATTFALSRYLFRDAVQSRFGGYLAWLNRMLQRDGAFCLLTLRLLHVPYTFVNYVSGASTVRAGTFCWTTLAGMLPGVMVFVYAGSQLPTLSELAEHGAGRLLDPGLIAALVLMGLLPLAARGAVCAWRRFLSRPAQSLQ